MIDHLAELQLVSKQEDGDLKLSDIELQPMNKTKTNENESNDRELVQEFLSYTKKA